MKSKQRKKKEHKLKIKLRKYENDNQKTSRDQKGSRREAYVNQKNAKVNDQRH